jgi:UDPglucose 6-dehydrogenase
VDTAKQFKTDLSIIKNVIKSNENRSKVLLNRIFKILKNKIKNKKITFLGVTFKANTDDMRESSSLAMIPSLASKGAKIRYYDPSGYKKDFEKIKNVTFCESIKLACSNADLIIIHTEWNDFKSLNFKSLSNKKGLIVYDMRNILSHDKMKKEKIKYFSIGK